LRRARCPRNSQAAQTRQKAAARVGTALARGATTRQRGAKKRPQGEPEVSELTLRPVFEDFPAWLGGMTQEEAGLAEMMLVAVA
jgi:hypothetical protein